MNLGTLSEKHIQNSPKRLLLRISAGKFWWDEALSVTSAPEPPIPCNLSFPEYQQPTPTTKMS